jgi:hypothetical protein
MQLEVCGRISGCNCSRRAKFAAWVKTAVLPSVSGVGAAWSLPGDLGLSRKPEHLGTALPQVNVFSNLPEGSDIRTIGKDKRKGVQWQDRAGLNPITSDHLLLSPPVRSMQ